MSIAYLSLSGLYSLSGEWLRLMSSTTVHNKYTQILGLWKCETIAQLSYCWYMCESWVLSGSQGIYSLKSCILEKVDKGIYYIIWLTAGSKSAQDIYFYRADLELDPEPTRTYTPLWSWVLACTAGHILWAGPWKLMISKMLLWSTWSILLSTYTHMQK